MTRFHSTEHATHLYDQLDQDKNKNQLKFNLIIEKFYSFSMLKGILTIIA